jgi:DNA (cytosine-5)-methyltransferase 1
MSCGAYYNEHDPYAAQWLRNLIAAGHIAPGDVDERSIEDVRPDDIRGYTQCHFFAGIGVWSYALRRAEWSDDRPVWSGSCPCQPFSAAGKGVGFADERHLWPAFHHIIKACRPAIVFGEQVASKDGLAWLDVVHADMEETGYTFAAVDLCAAGVGAPHIRQRLWFVADSIGTGIRPNRRGQDVGPSRGMQAADWQRQRVRPDAGEHGAISGMAHADGRDASAEREQPRGEYGQFAQDRIASGMADADCTRSFSRITTAKATRYRDSSVANGSGASTGPTNGFWRAADWLLCRDGKWRPVEPGTFPLAHGAPARVGRLRAYGNAINAEAAEHFIRAYVEVTECLSAPSL